MNRKSNMSMGPGAASLTLIFVMLSISVLGMLTLMNTRTDKWLGQRSIEVAQDIYQLNETAERDLAQLDGLLAECAREASSQEDYLAAIEAGLEADYFLDGNLICWIVTDEERMLDLAAEIRPLGDQPRLVWAKHVITAGMEEEWDW